MVDLPGVQKVQRAAVSEPAPNDEAGQTRYIMLALRRALLLVVTAIEHAYHLDSKERVVIIIER